MKAKKMQINASSGIWTLSLSHHDHWLIAMKKYKGHLWKSVHECLIHIGYFIEVWSQAKVMSKNNSIVIISKGLTVNLPIKNK